MRRGVDSTESVSVGAMSSNLTANGWRTFGKVRSHLTNSLEDGFYATAPVCSFPSNGYGLYDMTGNVWEWCLDWYRADYYKQPGATETNPRGPTDSLDPDERGVNKRVQRGGSFLCSDEYCVRYFVGARGKAEPSTPSANVGFRCVEQGH